MKVTFHQLEVFECVARRLSFTRAAEELQLSQPTVSAQMRQLTAEVGLPLFEQLGKTIHLTAAGRELLVASRQVFHDWSRFEMTVADLRGLKSGRLTVACATTAKYFTPDLLGPFCAAYPEVDIGLTIVNHDGLVERLRRNADDMTIMTLPPADLELDTTPLRTNPLVVVAPAGHPLAQRRNIPLASLKAERFIAREAGSGTRAFLAQFFEAAGFLPDVRMELGSNEAIKHVVAAGLGISVLSQHALDVDPALDRLTVLDVQGFPLDDQWYLVYPRGKRLSPVAQAFYDYAVAEAARAASAPEAQNTRSTRNPQSTPDTPGKPGQPRLPRVAHLPQGKAAAKRIKRG